MNMLMGRAASVEFDVQDTIPIDLEQDTLKIAERLYKNNISVSSSMKQLEISGLNLKNAYTLMYPKLNFSAGYNFSNTDNSAGSTLLSRAYGSYFGGKITIPLYSAGETSRKIAQAKLELESARFDLENTKLEASNELRDAIDKIDSRRKLLDIEKENCLLAKENLDISMQRMRLGQSTSLELRQAEESYEEARTRQINIEYDLKMAETSLKKLLADFPEVK
jgi:outer membrane protein